MGYNKNYKDKGTAKGQNLTGYRPCPSCSFKWSWATRTSCFSCGHELPKTPAVTEHKAPKGKWASGPPSTAAAMVNDMLQKLEKESPEDPLLPTLRADAARRKAAKEAAKEPWIQAKEAANTLQKREKARTTLETKLTELKEQKAKVEDSIKSTEEELTNIKVEIAELTEKAKLEKETIKDDDTEVSTLVASVLHQVGITPQKCRSAEWDGKLANILATINELKAEVEQGKAEAAAAAAAEAARQEEAARSQQQKRQHDGAEDADQDMEEEDVDEQQQLLEQAREAEKAEQRRQAREWAKKVAESGTSVPPVVADLLAEPPEGDARQRSRSPRTRGNKAAASATAPAVQQTS